MQKAFTLTITGPTFLMRQADLMNVLLDISDRISDQLCFDDDSYLMMSAFYNIGDSSYIRHNGFGFPLRVTLNRLNGENKVIKCIKFALWKREDSHCQVMFNRDNSPENNFEGGRMETLDWIMEKVKAQLRC